MPRDSRAPAMMTHRVTRAVRLSVPVARLWPFIIARDAMRGGWMVAFAPMWRVRYGMEVTDV